MVIKDSLCTFRMNCSALVVSSSNKLLRLFAVGSDRLCGRVVMFSIITLAFILSSDLIFGLPLGLNYQFLDALRYKAFVPSQNVSKPIQTFLRNLSLIAVAP